MKTSCGRLQHYMETYGAVRGKDLVHNAFLILVNIISDKVFKKGQSKICGRQSFKNLKEFGLLKQYNLFKQAIVDELF